MKSLDEQIEEAKKKLEEEEQKKKQDGSFAGNPDDRGGNGKERTISNELQR